MQTFNGNGTLLINYPSYMDMGIIMCRSTFDKTRLAFFNITGSFKKILFIFAIQNMPKFETVSAVGPAYIPPKQSSWWVSMDMTEGYTAKINYTVYGNPLNISSMAWQRTADGKVEPIGKIWECIF